MKKAILAAALILSLAITACNTIHGVGEDISGAADATKKVISR